MYDYSKIQVAPAAPQEKLYAPRSEITKGLAAFVDETQALGGGLAAMAGQAGASILPEAVKPYAEDVRDWGLDVYNRNMEESTAGWQAPKVARIEDIKSASDFGDWAAYQGSKGLATLAGLALSGGIGGAIAKAGARQATKKLAKTYAMDMAGKKLSTSMASTYAAAGGKEAGAKAATELAKRTTAGAIAGAGAGAFALEGGGAFGEQVGEGVAPEDALLPSFGVGVVNAALELVAPVSVARKLGLGTWATRGIAKQIKGDPALAKKAVTLAQRAKQIGAKGATGFAKTVATEGFTEGLQELVQIAGSRIAQDQELLAELTPEQRSQIMNAAAAGGLVGGLFGGAAGPFTQTKLNTAADVVRELPRDVQQLVTSDTQISNPLPNETRGQYLTRVAEEIKLEAATKAAAQAGQETAAPGTTTEVTPDGVRVQRPETGGAEAPANVGTTPEGTGAAQAGAAEQAPGNIRETLPLTPDEVAANAEAIRKDESGLYQKREGGEGMQADRRRYGEQAPEQGRQAPSAVSPEEIAARPTGETRPAVEVITRADGKPFGSRRAAITAIEQARKEGKLEDGVTRKVDGGWVVDRLESRQGPVEKSQAQVESDITKELGSAWLRRAQRERLIEISEDNSDPTGPAADYDPNTGKITIYRRRLREGSSAAQLLHEGSHATLDFLTEGQLANFAREIAAQVKINESASRAVTQATTAMYARLARKLGIQHNLWDAEGDALTAERERVTQEVNAALKALSAEKRAALLEDAEYVRNEETFAYFVQFAHDAKAGGGLFRRAVNSIKAGFMLTDMGQMLQRMGLGFNMTDALAVELARRSTRFAVELREESRRLGAQERQAEQQDVLESRIALTTRTGTEAYIYENPSLTQMKGMLNIAQQKARQQGEIYEGLRFLRDPRDGTIYAWDAGEDLLHKDVAERMGIDTERYNIVPYSKQAVTAAQIAEGLLEMPAAGRLESRAQVNTPEFQAWFGDSKIVDEDGEPLIVYRGRTSTKDPGLFFTQDRDMAAKYARGKGGRVESFYLKLENPIYTGETDLDVDQLVAEGYDGIVNEEDDEIIIFYPDQARLANKEDNVLESRPQAYYESGQFLADWPTLADRFTTKPEPITRERTNMEKEVSLPININGEESTVTMPLSEALTDVDSRLEQLEGVLKCLG